MDFKKILTTLTLFAGVGSLAALADVIIANADNTEVKVYQKASTLSDTVSSIGNGVQGELVGDTENFYKIRLDDGKEGFVLKKHTDRIATTVEFPSADAEAEGVDTTPAGERATFPCGKKSITVGKKTYDVADIYDQRTVYKEKVADRGSLFFIISKQEYRLYVYEKSAKDTVLVAHYPVCYAKRTGQKTKNGDMSTPETDMKGPFRISQIAAASSWTHDFKDGRGAIKAYGDWFMRLDLSKGTGLNASVRSNRSIGIHGSSGNRESVPGNDSEGCIRLRDEDLRHLKTNYAQVGTQVVVKPYSQGKYKFEKKAEKALGSRYVYPVKGYKKM